MIDNVPYGVVVATPTVEAKVLAIVVEVATIASTYNGLVEVPTIVEPLTL